MQGGLPPGPLLLACNHVSWLDPLVVAASVPCAPISKLDVRGWPLVGGLAGLLGVIFHARGDQGSGLRVLRQVEVALAAGLPVLNFPEGTTTDGAGVLRFHKGLFGLAARLGVPAVPVALRYLVPTPDVGRRLRQFGVPPDRIHFTGFPLPHELVGGPSYPALRRNLAGRLVRLDPHRAFRREVGDDVAAFLGPLPAAEEGRPPLLTFAVGGAGAQAELARRFLPSLRPAVVEGRLRLALVAEGQLAAAAWSGYVRLPKGGLYRILETVRGRAEAGEAARALG